MSGPAVNVRLDVASQFPVLSRTAHGKRLAYLDNAATTQKPRRVIDAEVRFYENSNANVHRGVHLLSQEATDQFEAARAKLTRLIGAHPSEVVFTKGCTEAINLVAHGLGVPGMDGETWLRAGDRILLTEMEHHANIVPWQVAAARTGARVEPIRITDGGEIDLDALRSSLDERVRVVGVKHVCNALGTVNPIREIADLARSVGALIVVDGAQAVAHVPVDVSSGIADFYTVSGHKFYGPTGTGALWGRSELLARLAPYQTGGNMIRTVDFAGTTYADPPERFEPGTPNIAGTIGLGAAVDFVAGLGYEVISAHENRLAAYAEARLREVPGLRLYGPVSSRLGIFSFTMDAAHPHDIGTVVDREGVAIRTGHHCCQPLMRRLGVVATARASLAVYNDERDVDQLALALHKVNEVFA